MSLVRLLTAMLAAGLLLGQCLAASSPASHQEVLAQQRRDATRDKIKTLRSSIRDTSASKAGIQAELKRSASEIAKVRKNLKNLRSRRAKSQQLLAAQTKEREQLQAQLAVESQLLEEIKRQRLEQLALRKQPQWAQSDPHQKARSEMLLEILSKRAEESIAKIKTQQKKLQAVVKRSERTDSRLRQTIEAENAEQKKLTAQRRERQKAAAKLDRLLAQQNQTLKKLQADERRLSRLMARLEKARPAKPSKARKAAAPKTQVAATVMPVDGKVAARFGKPRQGKGNMGVWKGMVFSIAGEKPVRAVRAGKVVFADYLRGYGNLLIIDHGNGYYSLYGNNASMSKDVGDQAASGEEIARVGSKSSDLSVLYFELRQNGKPIDPAAWLRI